MILALSKTCPFCASRFDNRRKPPGLHRLGLCCRAAVAAVTWCVQVPSETCVSALNG